MLYGMSPSEGCFFRWRMVREKCTARCTMISRQLGLRHPVILSLCLWTCSLHVYGTLWAASGVCFLIYISLNFSLRVDLSEN